jgi:hypothetical protein
MSIPLMISSRTTIKNARIEKITNRDASPKARSSGIY